VNQQTQWQEFRMDLMYFDEQASTHLTEEYDKKFDQSYANLLQFAKAHPHKE